LLRQGAHLLLLLLLLLWARVLCVCQEEERARVCEAAAVRDTLRPELNRLRDELSRAEGASVRPAAALLPAPSRHLALLAPSWFDCHLIDRADLWPLFFVAQAGAPETGCIWFPCAPCAIPTPRPLCGGCDACRPPFACTPTAVDFFTRPLPCCNPPPLCTPDELGLVRRQLARSQADNSRASTHTNEIEAACASRVRAAESELVQAQASISMLREVRPGQVE
jgi:hypothetical protein